MMMILVMLYRESLGENADIVEVVEQCQKPYEELPDQAKKRLGIQPGQRTFY